MEEIWKDIDGYEWIYQISNLWKVKTKIKYLSPRKHNLYYSRVQLHLDWIRKNYLIHRLVAQYFIPNLNNLPLVLHKYETLDENWLLYNWEDNLFWGTHTDNMQDMWKKWRAKNHFQLNHPRNWWAKNHNCKPVIQYSKEWVFIKRWESASIVELNKWINSASIAKCCKWTRKTAGGFKWAYTNITQ